MSRADPVRQRGAHESAASSSGSKQGYQPGCCGGGCCSLNGNVTRCWTFDPCTNHKVSVLEKPFPVASTDAAMVAMNPTAVSVAVAGSPAPRPLGTRANAWTADVDLSSMPAFGFRWFPTTCVVGPDWPCNVCTWTIVLAPSIPFLVLVAPKLHIGVLIAGAILLAINVTALALTAFGDPGYVPKQTPEEAVRQQQLLFAQGIIDSFSYCERCRIWRPPRTQHCHHCDACCMELDHHCPWMGKCIGKHNMTPFVTFVSTVYVVLGYAIVATIVWFLID